MFYLSHRDQGRMFHPLIKYLDCRLLTEMVLDINMNGRKSVHLYF